MLISSTLSFIQSVPVYVHNIVRLSERCLHASFRAARKIAVISLLFREELIINIYSLVRTYVLFPTFAFGIKAKFYFPLTKILMRHDTHKGFQASVYMLH